MKVKKKNLCSCYGVIRQKQREKIHESKGEMVRFFRQEKRLASNVGQNLENIFFIFKKTLDSEMNILQDLLTKRFVLPCITRDALEHDAVHTHIMNLVIKRVCVWWLFTLIFLFSYLDNLNLKDDLRNGRRVGTMQSAQ